jgi:hypothetical protein
MTMLGAMRASVPGLAAELGMDAASFQEAFLGILAKDMVRHDERAAFLCLPKFLRYNRPESPNVIRAWPGVLELLPECQLKADLFQHIKAFNEGLPKGFREASREVFGKGMPNQEQEQEPEQEPEETTSPPGTELEPVLFNPTNGNGNGTQNTLSDIIARAFAYFCEHGGKTKMYTLTEKRKKMAQTRWKETINLLSDQGTAPEKLELEAKRVFRKAMDGLLEDEFMNENGYVEWEQIFSSPEKFQKRIQRYENPPKRKESR